MRGVATLPDGSTRRLIDIADWDFRWQHVYRFVTPLRLPKGTTVSMRYTYDNSADNPRNPNSPPKPVYWGEQTTDEMLIAFLVFTLDSEQLAKTGQIETNWVPALPNTR